MPSPQYSYTLDDVIAAVRRRRRVFVYVALPIIAVASGLALTLPDVYRSVARISIDLEGANVQTLEPIQVAAYADPLPVCLGGRPGRASILVSESDVAVDEIADSI